MSWYTFPCGCSWPVLGQSGRDIPLLDIDTDEAPEDCPATWELLSRGLTKGVFQLEKPLGKQYSKRVKPDDMEGMAALISLLRPGPLKAVDDEGVSMTEHYCRRKTGEEETKAFHESLTPILGDTYETMVYQEHLMAIGRELAGFDPILVDRLRKGAAKKNQAELAELRELFLQGCEKVGILTPHQAKIVWGWIQACGRYLFCKAHAVSYAFMGYPNAYLKAHDPMAFFLGWLHNARHEQKPRQEMAELVEDAKLFDIVVEPPDLRSLEANFHPAEGGKKIRFGLSNIKGIGEAQVAKMNRALYGTDWEGVTWKDFLFSLSARLTSLSVTRLIESGALDWTKVSRRRMLAEFRVWDSLTEKEQRWVVKRKDEFADLGEALEKAAATKKDGGACANKNRVSILLSQKQMLDNPPTPLADTPLSIARAEEELLGISLTCSRIDSCNLSDVNTSCKDYLAGKTGFMVFGVEVKSVREFVTKRGKSAGQKMAFLSVADHSCILEDVVCFADVWKEASSVLTEGNLVILNGERDRKKHTLIVKGAWQAQ